MCVFSILLSNRQNTVIPSLQQQHKCFIKKEIVSQISARIIKGEIWIHALNVDCTRKRDARTDVVPPTYSLNFLKRKSNCSKRFVIIIVYYCFVTHFILLQHLSIDYHVTKALNIPRISEIHFIA